MRGDGVAIGRVLGLWIHVRSPDLVCSVTGMDDDGELERHSLATVADCNRYGMCISIQRTRAAPYTPMLLA